MRTIKQLPVPQDTDLAKFPDGQIQNQSVDDTIPGTPVVREIYGDILTNIYALIKEAGLTADGLEDSDVKGYQIVEALKKMSNSLNDIQQVMTVDGSNISLQLDFDHLPENYVFIGKPTENLLASQNYTLLGLGEESPLISSTTNVLASATVLVILNSGGSKIIDLTSLLAGKTEISTALGTPISFNESDQTLVLAGGKLMTNYPKAYNIENIVQVAESNLNLSLVDGIFHKERLIALFFDTALLKYRLWSFSVVDFSVIEGEITAPDLASVDNQPYMFCDGTNIYFTNSTNTINNSVNDYAIGKFVFDENTLEITSVSFGDVDILFEKTTNTFITGTKFYTLVSGNLYSYEIAEAREFVAGFNFINGSVFKQNGNTYYTNGDTATKWTY